MARSSNTMTSMIVIGTIAYFLFFGNPFGTGGEIAVTTIDGSTDMLVAAECFGDGVYDPETGMCVHQPKTYSDTLNIVDELNETIKEDSVFDTSNLDDGWDEVGDLLS